MKRISPYVDARIDHAQTASTVEKGCNRVANQQTIQVDEIFFKVTSRRRKTQLKVHSAKRQE